jgi:hypothetical protein
VLEGGRAGAAQARRRTYLRRRLVAAVVAVALVAALHLLAGSALAGTAGGGTPSAAAGATSPVTHVVQPGDTLWTIAERVAPGEDLRPVVDELRQRHGSTELEVGDRLDVANLG